MNRALSSIEQVNWLMDQAVSLNIIMIAHISGPLTGAVLRQALDLVQQKHPPLKWRIKEGSVPEFVAEDVPKIPLRIIERKSEDHWIEEAEKEINEQFPWTEGPLARVVQLVSRDGNESDLVFTLCHIATDGLSGIIAMKDLLTFVGKFSIGEPPVPSSPLTVPLSSIDLLKDDLRFEAHLPGSKDINDRYPPVELKGEKDVPPHQRITRIIHKELVSSEVKMLIRKCRKEKTSVQGALCAAFLQSVVEQIRKSRDVSQQGPLNIGSLSPVNIRRYFIKPTPEDIGYYISFAIHHQLVDEHESLWNTARQVKETLEAQIEAGQDIKAIFGVGDTLKTFTTSIRLARNVNDSLPPVVTTNLGRLDVPRQYGNLRVEKLHAAGAMNVASKSGLAFIANTYGDIMSINFAFVEPCRSRRSAEIIVEGTLKRLKEAIGSVKSLMKE